MLNKKAPWIALAIFVSGCGGSNSDNGLVDNPAETYTVTINRQLGDQTQTSESEVSRGEDLTITVDTPADYRFISASGCVGTLADDQSTYQIENVGADCQVDITFESIPEAPMVVSGRQKIEVSWSAEESVDVLWSTDPQCDWSEHSSCDNAGARQGVTSGGLELSAVDGDIELRTSYFFTLQSADGLSGVAAGKALSQRVRAAYKGAIDGNTLYVAGQSAVSSTLELAQINLSNGELTGALPFVSGSVASIVADGDGWIIGGDFSSVEGVPREGLARITALGALDASWDFPVQGDVLELAKIDDLLVVSGTFTSIDGMAAVNLAVIDLASQSVTPAPAASEHQAMQAVTHMVTSGNTVYTAWFMPPDGAGFGDSVISAYDVSAGEYIWHAELAGKLMAISADEAGIYYAAAVPSGGNQENSQIAFVNAQGATTDWRAELGDSDFIVDIAVDGDKLYAFSFPHRAAPAVPLAYELATAQRTPWTLPAGNRVGFFQETSAGVVIYGEFAHGDGGTVGLYNLTTDELIQSPAEGLGTLSSGDVEINGQYLLISGGSEWLEDDTGQGIHAFDSATGIRQAWQTDMPDVVMDMVLFNDTIYVGRERPDYIEIDRQWVRQSNYLEAINTETGYRQTLPVELDGAVSILQRVGNTLYFSGGFTKVNGVDCSGLAAFDLTAQQILPWCPALDGSVTAMTAHESTLYIGGDFTNINGVLREKLAGFNAATGDLIEWNVAPNEIEDINVNSLGLMGDTLIVGGKDDYPSYNYEEDYLELEFSTRALVTFISTDGNPNIRSVSKSGYYADVDVISADANTVYLGGALANLNVDSIDFLAGYPQPDDCCQSFAAMDFSTGAIDSFGLDASSLIKDIVIDGDMIYLIGSLHWMKPGERTNSIVAFDKISKNIVW